MVECRRRGEKRSGLPTPLLSPSLLCITVRKKTKCLKPTRPSQPPYPNPTPCQSHHPPHQACWSEDVRSAGFLAGKGRHFFIISAMRGLEESCEVLLLCWWGISNETTYWDPQRARVADGWIVFLWEKRREKKNHNRMMLSNLHQSGFIVLVTKSKNKYVQNSLVGFWWQLANTKDRAFYYFSSLDKKEAWCPSNPRLGDPKSLTSVSPSHTHTRNHSPPL